MHKTKKRFLSALLVCAMIIGLFPLTAFANEEATAYSVTSQKVTLTNNATYEAWSNDNTQLQAVTTEDGVTSYKASGASVERLYVNLDPQASEWEGDVVIAAEFYVDNIDSGKGFTLSSGDGNGEFMVHVNGSQATFSTGTADWKNVGSDSRTKATINTADWNTVEWHFSLAENGKVQCTAYVNNTNLGTNTAYNDGQLARNGFYFMMDGGNYTSYKDNTIKFRNVEKYTEKEICSISNSAGLTEAIKNQKDGQTWVLAPGEYNVTTTPNQSGKYGTGMIISKDNITIKAADPANKPVIYGFSNEFNAGVDGFNKNGQDTIYVSGQNVTLENLKIMPLGGIGENANDWQKTVEVTSTATGFTMTGCETLPNIKQHNGSEANSMKDSAGLIHISTDDAVLSGNNFGTGTKICAGWKTSENNAVTSYYKVTATGNVGTPAFEGIIVTDGVANVSDAVALQQALSDTTISSIKLANDITLTEKLTINKNLTIDGNGKTITGDVDNAGVYIEVTDGTFNLSNVTLKEFGGTVGTQSGNGVIKVPADAAEGTTVNTTNVNVSDFNRSAYDISAGTFSITGGTIDCTNSNTANTILTKGIKAGGTNSKVSGTISGVTIMNSASKYEEWNTAAIEIYSNADVDVTNCTISNVNKGIHVDNYWYDTGDITVDINGGNIAADSDAVMIYSKENAANNAAVNISSGSFSGNVRILDKTDKDNISITGGTFTVDPSDYVASGYTVQKNSDSTYEVIKKSSSGSTVTPTPTPDPEPEEPSDSEDTITNPDGSTTTTITKEDGSSSTTTVDNNGKVESEVTVSEEAVSNADGAAVALPIPEVPVTTDKASAPTVTVNLPSKDATKVEVPVKDVTPGTVAVLVDADGNETVIKDTVQSENGITVELTDGATIKIVDNSKSFDDVTSDYWGASAIDFATSRELFAGTGENEFSPEGQMTRAMIWSVLARYEGADTKGASGSDWYAGPQQWAIENGISDGTMANSAMTREQLAAMLYRYVGSPAVSGTVGDYTDADSISSWASDAMRWAVQKGLIAGMGENTLNPQGTATRTQVAAILQRFIENKMA